MTQRLSWSRDGERLALQGELDPEGRVKSALGRPNWKQ